VSGAVRLPGTDVAPSAGGGRPKAGRFVQSHKKELAIGGVAVVGAFALRARSKKTASVTGLATGTAGIPPTGDGTFTGGGGGNDSTASDFASYVQSTFEPLQQKLSDLTANQNDLAAAQTGTAAVLEGLGSSVSALQGRYGDGFGTPASPVTTPVADAPATPTQSGAPGQPVPVQAPVVPIAAPSPSLSAALSAKPEQQWTASDRNAADLAALPGYRTPTAPPATRAIGSFDAAAQQRFKTGYAVKAGDGRWFRLVGGVPTYDPTVRG
jgi:hypothetical protein